MKVKSKGRKALAVTLERRVRVSEYLLEGKSLTFIAKQTGVSVPQIHKDIQAVKVAWQNSIDENMDTIKAEQLAKIDKLEATLWDAWHKSAKDTTKVFKKQRKEITGNDKKTEVDVKEQTETDITNYGNPAFLAQIRDCIKLRIDVLGILEFNANKVVINMFENE